MGSIAIAADKTVCVCRLMQVTHRPWLDDLGLSLTAHGQHFFCVASLNLYAGTLTFRVCNKRWGVISFFTD